MSGLRGFSRSSAFLVFVLFQVFYGVSGNTHNFWSIANARKVIGYAPEDNSQMNFADQIAAIAKG